MNEPSRDVCHGESGYLVGNSIQQGVTIGDGRVTGMGISAGHYRADSSRLIGEGNI